MADCPSGHMHVSGTSKGHNSWWTGIHGEEHVVKLNSTNYDKFISDRNAFIMYFAPWCGHSRNCRAAFAATADKLAREGNTILIGALDCDECKGICARYRDSIPGFPTFLYLSAEGTTHQYQHSRTLDSFYNWIIDHQKRHQEHKHHNHGSDNA